MITDDRIILMTNDWMMIFDEDLEELEKLSLKEIIHEKVNCLKQGQVDIMGSWDPPSLILSLDMNRSFYGDRLH